MLYNETYSIVFCIVFPSILILKNLFGKISEAANIVVIIQLVFKDKILFFVHINY